MDNLEYGRTFFKSFKINLEIFVLGNDRPTPTKQLAHENMNRFRKETCARRLIENPFCDSSRLIARVKNRASPKHIGIKVCLEALQLKKKTTPEQQLYIFTAPLPYSTKIWSYCTYLAYYYNAPTPEIS